MAATRNESTNQALLASTLLLLSQLLAAVICFLVVACCRLSGSLLRCCCCMPSPVLRALPRWYNDFLSIRTHFHRLTWVDDLPRLFLPFGAPLLFLPCYCRSYHATKTLCVSAFVVSVVHGVVATPGRIVVVDPHASLRHLPTLRESFSTTGTVCRVVFQAHQFVSPVAHSPLTQGRIVVVAADVGFSAVLHRLGVSGRRRHSC